MKKLISKVPALLILLLFLVSACSEKETADTIGFTVIGQIKNAGEVKQISLQELTTNGLTQLDTSAIDANGNFTLTGTLTEKTFCILRFQKGDVVLVVDSNSHLKVTIDALEIGNYMVENSKENEELRQLYLINDSFMRKSSEVNQRFSTYSEANLTEAVQLQIRAAFDSLQFAHKNAVKTYIGSLSHSIIPYFASTFLLPEPDLTFLQSLDETLFAEFSNSKYAIQLHDKVESMKKTSGGAMAPDIMLNDPFGKTVSLSQLKGKVVLVDFWASWCGPCREENPKNVLLYQKYKNSGLEIFGVSLDENRDSWINAINKDKLLWIHGSDLQKWNSPIVTLYNIDAIPYTILVDKEGKIIARKLRGKDLEDKLKDIFGF